ncbi:MAG: hypothetical protein Q9227_007449 [Pyrenula ochraceoflavens]
MVVDWIMTTTYGETDVDDDPVLIPRCGHPMTMSSMDGMFDMQKTFKMSAGNIPVGLSGTSEPFSAESLKTCPMCRSPLRDLNRYNRIVRRGMIDESTKKFIVWSNAAFAPLAERVQTLESELVDSQIEARAELGTKRSNSSSGSNIAAVKLSDNRNQFLQHIQRISDLKSRYKGALRLRQDVSTFLRRVRDGEQPFGRIWNLVENERRRKGRENPHFQFQVDVLQTRSRLLTTSLLIRCDLAIFSDFFALRTGSSALMAPDDFRVTPLKIDFAQVRKECLELSEEAASRKQPLTQVEAYIYSARFAALERSNLDAEAAVTERHALLKNSGLEQLEMAENVAKLNPGSVRGMSSQISDIRRMLNNGVFYSVVTSQETQDVYRALSQEFRGTGHWYRCVNGHPFTIGECGMPMQTSRCPQCGSPVGGEHHQTVDGVTRDVEMESLMGNLTLGDRP